MAQLTISAAIEVAIEQFYKNTSPEMVSQNLHILLQPPTFATAENLAESLGSSVIFSRFHSITRWFLQVALIGAFFFGLVHVSYLLISAGDMPWYIDTVSIALGIIFGAKGLFLLVTTSR